MSIYVCEICGYLFDEAIEGTTWDTLNQDWKCPLCTAPKACFKMKEETDAPTVRNEVYICEICGYRYDDTKEDKTFVSLPDNWICPLCHAAKAYFKKEILEKADSVHDTSLTIKENAKHEDALETSMQLIHEMAIEGHSRIEAMRTQKAVPSFDDILVLGAQLHRSPLPDHSEIQTTTIIGSSAQKPMVLQHPVLISHMSFGALSKEAKIALAKGSAAVSSAQCSGEGGILPEEKANAFAYIFEYVPNKYSVSDENLKNVDAIEIKIGQGSKPGMGGHLPGEKVTEEIAKIRNKPIGKDIISPSSFEEIQTKEDLKDMVDMLRKRSEGRPIGIKIAAGHIEQDLAWIQFAQPDFITIDGRGGATGASPKYLKDNTTVPTIYALARAKAYMQEHQMKQELIITGGFRTSGEMIKAIAMGAHAIAIASAAMIAIGCQQYRVCHNGNCPMGIATQDPALRKNFDIEKGAKRLENYMRTLLAELCSFARIAGHQDLHAFSEDDLITTSQEIATYTNIKHA